MTARPSPSLASCYAKAVLRPGSVASILLLAGCTPRGPTGVTEPPADVLSFLNNPGEDEPPNDYLKN